MAKRSDTYLFMRIPGKTIELLEMMLKEVQDETQTTIDLTNKSALTVVCEKFLADSVYHAAYGRLIQKYGDKIAEHYDPYYVTKKQEMAMKRAADEQAKRMNITESGVATNDR